MASWKLENVEQKAKENRNRFFIASKKERARQKIGDEVRLHFVVKDFPEVNVERMWVKITKEKKFFSKYEGVLVNTPIYIKYLKQNDAVIFDANNIAQTIIKKVIRDGLNVPINMRWFQK